MKILYVYHENVDDNNKMSGTVKNIYQMLIRQGHDVIVLSGLKHPVWLRVFNKVKHMLIGKHNIAMNMDKLLLKSYARQIEKKAKKIEYDLVFAPLSSYYAYYTDSKPTVFFIDSNIGCLKDYYWDSSDYSEKDISIGFELEKLALEHTTLAIYASNWAREAAIRCHNGDPTKIVAINRGANVRHKLSTDEIWELINKRGIIQKRKCQLIFIGKDWERKGGAIACQVVKALNENGFDAVLKVVGCVPEIPEECRRYVEVVGFLNKNNKDEYEKMDELFKKSDFFILPTQAEAQGISYIEAASWGVPPIGCATGGVGDVVIEGVTGILMATDATPEEYVKKIGKFINNPNEYIKLAQSAHAYYHENMSWDAVGRRIFTELKERM